MVSEVATEIQRCQYSWQTFTRYCLHQQSMTAYIAWRKAERNSYLLAWCKQNTNRWSQFLWKKRSEETQTLHAGCSKVEPKIFVLPQTPSRGAGRPKFNRLDHYLHLQTQFGEDRCTQFRVIVVTDPQTHRQTGPITIHCTVKLSAQCN